MTFSEANNMIDDISWFYGGESISTDDIVECREICHKALEKQIPKKVKFADGGNELLCPYCNYDLMGSTNEPEHDPPYCFECGQALDWSDAE